MRGRVALAALGSSGLLWTVACGPAFAADPPEPPRITAPLDGQAVTATAPTVKGTGAPRDTVIVTASEQFLCAAIVGADGTWQCRAAGSLNQQTYVLAARQLDRTGVLSESGPGVTVTIGAVEQRSSDRTGAGARAEADRQKPLAIAAIAGLALTVGVYAYAVMRPGATRRSGPAG